MDNFGLKLKEDYITLTRLIYTLPYYQANIVKHLLNYGNGNSKSKAIKGLEYFMNMAGTKSFEIPCPTKHIEEFYQAFEDYIKPLNLKGSIKITTSKHDGKTKKHILVSLSDISEKILTTKPNKNKQKIISRSYAGVRIIQPNELENFNILTVHSR